ncbi:hypothetical protein B6U79_03805 [Candidatus Bathyarchaeota archaeon ex4484_231]|nr:MAG: hypothetical protein B6U79_03805 [Candidatus Bathyarchaeota archaeon ex4484_231]
MFCPNCGKKVDEGSNFCQYCGFRLVSLEKMPVKEVLRNTLIRRIEGIKHRNPKIIEAVVLKEKYTKFDDWPPFELQESEALSNEAKALKVLKRQKRKGASTTLSKMPMLMSLFPLPLSSFLQTKVKMAVWSP